MTGVLGKKKSSHFKRGKRKETAWAEGNEDDSEDPAMDLLSDSSGDEAGAGDEEDDEDELDRVPRTGV
jgi:hypothetical protein